MAFSKFDPQSGFGDWFPEEFVPEPRDDAFDDDWADREDSDD